MPAETMAREAKTEENDIMSEEVNKTVFKMFREMSAGKRPVFLDDKEAGNSLDDLQARLDNLTAETQEPAPRRSY
ncbi:MAG: hypothetical protein Tsb0016_11030 [Sphingomonadales bacterium]